MNAQHRDALERIFGAAVDAVHPRTCLAPHLPSLPAAGRLVVLAAGKAAASMAAATEAFYLGTAGVAPDRLVGLAVTRHGYGAKTRRIEVVEAGHPVPDEAGLEATRRTLELAAGATADDLVLVLLSGGGSANWVAPAGALSLAEKQAVTRAFLRSGATITDINTVRKKLSRIKGGRLAAHAAPARLVTLAISDVPGDDPSIIASGPTVPDPTTRADALAVAQRFGVELPPSAQALLADPANETPKPGDPAFARSTFRIIGRPAEAMAATAAAARREGYEPVVIGHDLEGEAREVARAHALMAMEIQAAGRRAALLSGGELTVTVSGDGRGGPNQEYCLALALAIAGQETITAVAGDTDGTDGGGGAPTDPAGAFVDGSTAARGQALGLDPAAFLAKKDSTGFFQRLGDLLTPGPTLTNVNDCRVILIDGR